MSNAVGIKAMIAAAAATLSVYLGELIIPFFILIFAMAADYITGMAKAWVTKTLSSKAGIRGALKKVGYLVVIFVAMCTDWLIASMMNKVGIPIPVSYLLGAMVIVWLILNELLSILENLAVIGVPFPKFLMMIVKKLKQHDEDEAEVIENEMEK